MPPMTDRTVHVPAGQHAYDIHIGSGLLGRAGTLVSPFLSRPRVVVVTDRNVETAHGLALRTGLDAAGVEHAWLTLDPGESTKNFTQLEKLTIALLDLGVERNDCILAFGGGVTGDITGFAAAIVRRGCRFIQIPTTLLAQVDSAVGGKTAINVPGGKNLVGAFHQPVAVITDTATPDTLDPRERRAGYAEIVKYGLIGDRDFFDWLERNAQEVLSGDTPARIHAVTTSCRAKSAIVAGDEREKGQRALLNLGHTFGHCLETVYGYDGRLLHGEGVALGMVLAFDYSVRLGLCSPDDAQAVRAHLARSGLPVRFGDLPGGPLPDGERLVEIMMQDKKVEHGSLTLILAEGIGQARIHKNADTAGVRNFLDEKTGRNPGRNRRPPETRKR